jgi:hypothetical protein
MKKIYFFSRVAAVMLAAMLFLPLYANQNAQKSLVIPDNLPEETVVTHLGTFHVGQMITDHALWNKVFHSNPEPYNNHRVETLGNLPPTIDAKTGIEQWRLDTICCLGFRDAEINAVEYIFNEDSTAIVKKINHSITLTVERENYVEPGPFYYYGEVPAGTEPDPSLVHDTTFVYVSDGQPIVFRVWFMYYYVSKCYVTYDETAQRNIFYREWSPIHTALEQEHFYTSSNPDIVYLDPGYYSPMMYVNKNKGETTISVSCQEVSEKHMAKNVDFKIICVPDKKNANVLVSTTYCGDPITQIDIKMDSEGQVYDNPLLYARVQDDWAYRFVEWSDTWQTEWTITSSNKDIVAFDQMNRFGFWLTPVSLGSATITVSWLGNEEYKAANVVIPVNISEKQGAGIGNVQGDKVQSTKRMEDGMLMIIRNGVKYNAAGQIVK